MHLKINFLQESLSWNISIPVRVDHIYYFISCQGSKGILKSMYEIWKGGGEECTQRESVMNNKWFQ